MDNTTPMAEHFSHIADSYQDLRTTDDQLINHILTDLPRHDRLQLLDIGCGTGRYDRLLLEQLDDSHLIGNDANDQMLEQFDHTLAGLPHGMICSRMVNVPMEVDRPIDVVLSFNALHHMNLGQFFTVLALLLRPGGVGYIYTRTKEQNQMSVWGKYFPKFTYYETRLPSLTLLERTIYQNANLSLVSMTFFEYRRQASLARLHQQARGKHYSTFSLYAKDELKQLLPCFDQQVHQAYGDRPIRWLDRNVLLKVVHR